MVEINGNNPQLPNLKLKGTDKSINLNNLKGLQKTEQNKSLFDKYDFNHNGVIDDNEVKSMQNNLKSIAGNNTLSQREINSAWGDNNAFAELNALADQQKAYETSNEYTETKGNVTTHYEKATFAGKGITYDTIKNDDGSVTTRTDKSSTTEYKDGSVVYKDENGSKLTTKDGNNLIYTKTGYTAEGKNGEYTSYYYGSKPQISEKMEYITKDGQSIQQTTRYSKDGKLTSISQKEGNTVTTTNYAQDGTVSNVTVSGRDKDSNGKLYSFETTYASDADRKAGKPQQEIRNGDLSALKQTTTYSYDAKGNVKAETKNAANETTTKFTNSKGETINAKDFDAPSPYTVHKGDSITKIATAALKEQGVENPTKEQIQEARTQLMSANKEKLGKYNGPKKEWANNRFFYPNTEISIPKFDLSKAGVQKQEEPTNIESAMEKAFGKDAKLPDGYTADFKDGKLILKDDKGKETTVDKTKLAMIGQSDDPDATSDKVNNTSDSEDVISMMKDSDSNKSGTIDKTEFSNYIKDMLNSANFEINDKNKAKVDELINNSFTSLDSIKQDGMITKEELTKNASAVINKLVDDLSTE